MLKPIQLLARRSLTLRSCTVNAAPQRVQGCSGALNPAPIANHAEEQLVDMIFARHTSTAATTVQHRYRYDQYETDQFVPGCRLQLYDAADNVKLDRYMQMQVMCMHVLC